MKAGVPKETFERERRVALVPADIAMLQKAGLSVVVERGAGAAAGYPDEAYAEKGAELVDSRAALFASADMLLQVRAGGAHPAAFASDAALLRPGQVVISFLEPLWEPNLMAELADKGVTALSMELMPRISRAQSMDALSAQGNIAGYRAVLLAAATAPRMFPMLMTAAGTISPARVFVIGAGVAGLQAIATAKRLGARVEAYDVRPVVKDQVESVGGTFVELPLETGTAEGSGGYAQAMDEAFYQRQRAFMGEVAARSDVLITTAAIPGRRSPLLLTREGVEGMQPASVVVDMAAERGGNCEVTRPDETVVVNGVIVLGPTDLPSTVAYHASQTYSRTVATFVRHLVKDGELVLDTEDEITRDTLVTHDGKVVHARVKGLLEPASQSA